jgi:hypothetical protein
MAGSFSDYLELELLDHVFGNAAYTAPATLYIALFTVAPNDAGSGGTEVTGGSYARKAVTNNATNFPAAVAGAKSNGVAITFAQATASWGTVAAFAIYDDLTGGNMLGWADLSASVAVASGDTATFAIGDLDITLT